MFFRNFLCGRYDYATVAKYFYNPFTIRLMLGRLLSISSFSHFKTGGDLVEGLNHFRTIRNPTFDITSSLSPYFLLPTSYFFLPTPYSPLPLFFQIRHSPFDIRNSTFVVSTSAKLSVNSAEPLVVSLSKHLW